MPSKFGNNLSAAVGVLFVGSFAMMHFADASPAFKATDIVSHRTPIPRARARAAAAAAVPR